MYHEKSPPRATHTPDGSGDMFDRVAQRYDLLNKCMSLGLDDGWRRRLVQKLDLRPQNSVLDVATGTADVALSIYRRHPTARITGLDPSHAMLAIGERKIAKAKAEKAVNLVAGDAQDLPFADSTFDAACISFGIRNVPDRLLGLQEMVRVVKPMRPVVVLELAEPEGGWLAPLARFHVHVVAPWLGALLSGAAEYRYLQRSIAAFPAPDTFARMMREAGLQEVNYKRLSFGALHLYWGRTPRK